MDRKSICKLIERCAGIAKSFYNEIQDDDKMEEKEQVNDDNINNDEIDDNSCTSSAESDDFAFELEQVASV